MIALYVTPLIVPVSPSVALIRIPAQHVSRMIMSLLSKLGVYISFFPLCKEKSRRRFKGHTVHRVLNLGTAECDSVNCVVGTATDGADR